MNKNGGAAAKGTGNRRPKSLILDVFGRYSAQFDGWVAVGDLIDMMALLDIDEQAVRSAVSRMTRRGLLAPDVRANVRGYCTTADADLLLADGDRRIYVSMEPARLEDGWVLVSFSLPESDRNRRHVLRSKLMWHGLGNLSNGLWIGPARVLDDVSQTIEENGFAEYTDVFHASYAGLGDVDDLVSRSWDLAELSTLYSTFLADHGPALASIRRRRTGIDDAEAFALYTRALHEWRKFPYLDPGLPTELLPTGWPGRSAAELFAELRRRLEDQAFDYAESVAARQRT